MRYLSLFSGIEACTQAWHPLGWTPVAFCEFDKFPSAVLAHHYPNVPNLGDVTAITDEQIAALGPIDVVVGGSPCQDLSVAGKRAGLDGARSGLFHEQLRIFHAARHLCGARYLLWENVPGAFSVNQGRDFGVVVAEMAGLESVPVPPKGWGSEGVALGPNGLVEWCVLDAQWFGVAQRRRRVFALLDVGNWGDRRPILLEPQGVRGDSAPSREKREEVARTIADCFGSSRNNLEKVAPVRAAYTSSSLADYREGVGTLRANGGDLGGGSETLITSEVAETLIASDHKEPKHNRNHNFIAQPITFGAQMSTPQTDVDMVQTLQAENPMAVAIQDVRDVEKAQNGRGWNDDGSAYTVDTHATQGVAVAQPVAFAQNTRNEVRLVNGDGQIVGALAAEPGMKQTSYVAQPSMQVRRLTAVECERLQGFPDDYTAIPWRNKTADQCPDGPRYKALGNSMAVPVMRWIAESIVASS